MQIETYLLPEFWACPLINGDYSGLNDVDEKSIKDWMTDNNNPDFVDCNDSPEFTHFHDARGYVLACDCLTFTAIKGE